MSRAFAAVVASLLACSAWADEVRPKDASGEGVRDTQFEVLKQVSLAAKWTKPAFYHSSPLLPVDRGRALYIARGAFHGPELVYLLELGSLEQTSLRVPTTAFAAEHPELSLKPVVEDLLCYDRTDGRAGVLVKDSADRKVYFLWWDLKQDRISKALLLREKGPTTKWIAVRALAYDPARKECLVKLEKNDGPMPSPGISGGPFTQSVLAVGAESVREIATFSAKFMTSHGPYYDAVHQRAVVTEITEHEGAEPHGYLVDLTNGGVRPFPIPQLVYGFTFDPDGHTLYAYGVKAREVVAINVATGVTVRRRRLGDIGHALGFHRGSLLVVGNVRLHFLDPRTLGHRAKIETQRVLPGLLNAEGSLVLPGILALKDFYTLQLVKLHL